MEVVMRRVMSATGEVVAVEVADAVYGRMLQAARAYCVASKGVRLGNCSRVELEVARTEYWAARKDYEESLA